MVELEALIEAARAGEEAAFGALVARYQDMAVGYAYARLGDAGLAEDAAQEAFLAAWRGLPTLRVPGAFGAWLKRLLFKQCDRIRRRAALDTVSLDAALDRPAADPDPLERMGGLEMADRLRQALRVLPPGSRTVILLHYMADQSLAEIGAFLDLPVSTMKKRLFDARARLKEALLDQVADELRARRPSRGPAFAGGVMELLQAAGAGDADGVRRLLAANPRLAAARDPLGNTALVVAVNGGRPAVARLLLAAGVRPRFHELAALGWTKRLARRVARRPARLESESPEGFTPLGLAAHFGHLETVEWLLDRGAAVDNAGRHSFGVTPLLAALFGGRTAVARRLIERGADVTRARARTGSPRDGWTALHYAVAGRHTEIENLLRARLAAVPRANQGGPDE